MTAEPHADRETTRYMQAGLFCGRRREIFEVLLQARAHLSLGLYRKRLRLAGKILRRELFGCFAQKLELGGIASAPNAVQQVYFHGQ